VWQQYNCIPDIQEAKKTACQNQCQKKLEIEVLHQVPYYF
jgi:hypothetical protein